MKNDNRNKDNKDLFLKLLALSVAYVLGYLAVIPFASNADAQTNREAIYDGGFESDMSTHSGPGIVPYSYGRWGIQTQTTSDASVGEVSFPAHSGSRAAQVDTRNASRGGYFYQDITNVSVCFTWRFFVWRGQGVNYAALESEWDRSVGFAYGVSGLRFSDTGLGFTAWNNTTNLSAVLKSNSWHEIVVEANANSRSQELFVDGSKMAHLDSLGELHGAGTIILGDVSNYAEHGLYVYDDMSLRSFTCPESAVQPPIITVCPESQTVWVGTNVVFGVKATGSEPLTYQWQFEGTNRPSATNLFLLINNVQLGDAGRYTVVVTNSAGAATCDPAVLTVKGPPLITVPPESQTNVVGSTVVFGVKATGGEPLTYQWQHSGTNLIGQTNIFLVLTNVQLSDAGLYQVTVTNPAGSASASATLTVWEPPVITRQPQSQTNVVGSNAVFSVVAEGTAPLGYLWWHEGKAMPEETNATLTLANVQTNQAGSYVVDVSNPAGFVESSNALLTVWQAPVITRQPQSQTNVVGSNAVFSVVAEGTAPLGYLWWHEGKAMPEETNATLALANLQTNQAGSYVVDVSNPAGFVESSNALLTVWQPPVITRQPQSQTNVVGSTVEFSVVAEGTAPLSYQWRHGEQDVGGQTNSVFTLTNIQSSDGGSYTVRVSNPAGFVVSSEAMLTVLSPVSLSLQDAGSLEGDITTNYLQFVVRLSNTNSQPVFVDYFTRDDTAKAGKDYVATKGTVRFQPGDTNQTISVAIIPDLLPETDIMTLFLYLTNAVNAVIADDQAVGTIVDDDPKPDIMISDTAGTSVPNGVTNMPFQVYLSRISGETVTVDYFTSEGTAKEGLDYLPAKGTLAFSPGATNGAIPVTILDNAAARTKVWFFMNLTNATNYGTFVNNQGRGTITPGRVLPRITVPPVSQVVTAGTDVAFSVQATGTAPLKYQWWFQKAGQFTPTNLVGQANTNLLLGKVQLEDAGTYSVTVTNMAGSDTASATLTVLAPITITRQPESQTNIVGGTAEFRVEATGAPPLTCQWLRDGTPVSGETGFTLTLTNLHLDRAGLYSARLRNPAGSTNSSSATLTIWQAPSVTRQPQSQTNVVGGTVVFSVEASGMPAVSYQWSHEDSPISGETNATLTLPNVQTNQAGLYAVAVSNAVHNLGISITNQLAVHTNVSGNTLVLSAERIDATPVLYQWWHDGSPMLGETNATLTLTNVQANEIGAYAVAANYQPGYVVSSNAKLLLAVTITRQPESRTNFIGSTAVFSVEAVGSPPITYQWWHDGTPMPGETNATLTMTKVHTNQAAWYRVGVSNPASFEASSNALLTVVEPRLAISDVTQFRGHAGLTSMVFPITLDLPSDQPVTVNYATTNGTAIAGNDYLATNGVVTFAPSQTNQSITVLIKGSTLYQTNHSFYVHLWGATNAGIAKPQGVGTITNDIPPPTLSIIPAPSVERRRDGETNLIFRVRLSAPSSLPTTVKFYTTNGTAVAGVDYAATNGELTFSANSTLLLSFPVRVLGNPIPQGDRFLYAVITDAQNAVIGIGQDRAKGWILDTALAPALSIEDAVVKVGLGGAAEANFPVTLSSPNLSEVTLDYRTTNGTAKAGIDYVSKQGTLTFPTNTMATNISVTVMGSEVTNKTFFLQLANATNVILSRSNALGTIVVTNAPPPTVEIEISVPTNRTVFVTNELIQIEASVVDPQHVVQRVEFYASGRQLGAAGAVPYRLLWPGAALGRYDLVAQAIDRQGKLLVSSTPVAIVVSDACGQAAIVRNLAHPEIDMLQDYLFEVGVSGQVFDHGGVTPDQLTPFRLVIWDDLGVPGLTDADVSLFSHLFQTGVSLYLIGEDLLGSASRLSTATQNQWLNLVHLKRSGSAVAAGPVTLDRSSAHPIVMKGNAGDVADFNYGAIAQPGVADGASSETVLGRQGGQDVLLVYEDQANRLVTQTFGVWSGTDQASLKERRTLFENAVRWLLRCEQCGDVTLNIAATASPAAVNVNQEQAYTVTVAGTGGECDALMAVVTVLLPAGMQFLSAESTNPVEYVDGVVKFRLERVSRDPAKAAQMVIRVRPTQAGTFTNSCVVGASNTARSYGTELVTQVTADQLLLSISATNSATAEVSIIGPTGRQCVLEASTNLVSWSPVWTNMLTNVAIPWQEPQSPRVKQRFFRAKLTP